MKRLALASLLCIACGCACGSPPAEPADAAVLPSDDVGDHHDSAGTSFVWADVASILQTRCVPCHRAGQIGGFALDTYAGAHLQAPRIAQAVGDRRMPPFPPSQEAGCPTVDDFRNMPDTERSQLASWAYGGAPRGVGGPDMLVPASGGPLGTPTHRWPMPTAYTPPPVATRPDDYRCFVIDPAVTSPIPVAAMSVEPGARGIVHHAIAYMVAPAQADQARAMEGSDGAPGYTCFGGAMVTPAYLTGIWVPGDASVLVPPRADVGYYFPAGWQVILQVHYNVQRADPAPDTSSVVVWDTPGAIGEVPRTLIVGDFTFSIPARSPSYARTVTASFTATGTTDVPYTSAAEGMIYAATPHMHRLGHDVRMELVHADGTSECVLHVPAWSFDWQGIYRLHDGIRARAGDQLRVTCEWQNPMGDTVIGYGEGSTDEMCIASVTIWSGG